MACKHQYYDFQQNLCWKDKKKCPYEVPNELKCEKAVKERYKISPVVHESSQVLIFKRYWYKYIHEGIKRLKSNRRRFEDDG